jgi:DNA polymerase I
MPARLPEPGNPEVLYVVDMSSFVLRAYHAMGPLSSPVTGEATQAVYTTVNMLERLLREQRPALLAVAMDSGRDTFRREIYPEYKATRPPSPDDLKHQFVRCTEIVEAFAIPILKQDGVEADDLIACAVKLARQRGLSVVIVAADKDLMQLVARDVVMWDTMRDRVIGPDEVKERFGVEVSQLRDLFALMGDTSDNIPGVPHVGPKTARDLLLEFGTLEGIYEHLDSIKKKAVKATLTEHRADAILSQKLVTLKEDCPIELNVEELATGGRDVERLKGLYRELGFTRQLQALEALPSSPAAGSAERRRSEPPKPATPARAASTEAILDAASLAAAIEQARAAGRMAIVSETVDASPQAPLVGLAFACAAESAWYLPLGHRTIGAPAQVPLAEARRLLAPLLADPEVKKAAHGLKREAVVLGWHELPLAGGAFDCDLCGYLLDPEGRHTLEDLAQRELGLRLSPRTELTKPARGRELGFDEIEVAEATRHSGARAAALVAMRERLAGELSDAGLEPVYKELELPLASLLARLELAGVLVDVERLSGLGAMCEAELARLEHQAHAVAGKPFNLHSPRQLETILFDELGLKPLKRTRTSRSTDAATLEALAEENDLPRVILEHRQIAKLKGTYIDALPRLVNPKTGRIHTSWEQTVAATGRISSVDPNLQNIPVRSELGKAIRSAFVAPPGQLLVSADYSQIELRVLAHLSQDPVLLEAFRTGQDVHTRTAMEVFEVDAESVTPEMRRRAKAVNFGVIYGQGESGLARSLGIARSEAASFIAKYFRRQEGVRRFMNQTLDAARAGEAVRTMLGRRRLIPDIKSGNRAVRLAAERIAMNMPIQGSAADLLKLAMLALAEPPTPGTRMILTVHDELVFEVPEAEVDLATQRIREAMEGVYPLDVPLDVDVGVGRTWAEAK